MSIVFCLFAVFGAFVSVLCVAGLFLLPLPCGMVTIWRIGGDCADLEHRVRAYCFLRHLGIVSAPLVLADCGLDPMPAACAACIAKRFDGVVLVPADDLEAYIKMVDIHDGRA